VAVARSRGGAGCRGGEEGSKGGQEEKVSEAGWS
jgi:hypothetical protein